MKYYFLLFFFVFMSISQLSAQISRDTLLLREAKRGQKTIIKSNPLPLLWGNIPLRGDSNSIFPITSEYRFIYEAPIAPHQTVLAGISYLGKNIPFAILALRDTNPHPNLKDLAVRGFRIQGMYRFYLTERRLAPKGFYFGPHFSYSYVKIFYKPHPTPYYKLIYSNLNLICGAQALLWNKIALDFFTGIGYKFNKEQYFRSSGLMRSSEIDSPLKNTKLTLGLNMGYAF